jgi:hypothetical protein
LLLLVVVEEDLTLVVAVVQVVLFLITLQCLEEIQELQGNHYLLVDFLLQEIMQFLLVVEVLEVHQMVRVHHKLEIKEQIVL